MRVVRCCVIVGYKDRILGKLPFEIKINKYGIDFNVNCTTGTKIIAKRLLINLKEIIK